MRIKLKVLGLISLTLFIEAYASFVCEVQDPRGERWTFVSYEEKTARFIADAACAALEVNPSDCHPKCIDNEIPQGRWHCVITNLKGNSWSFYGGDPKLTYSLAKTLCDSYRLNPQDCVPQCLPE